MQLLCWAISVCFDLKADLDDDDGRVLLSQRTRPRRKQAEQVSQHRPSVALTERSARAGNQETPRAERAGHRRPPLCSSPLGRVPALQKRHQSKDQNLNYFRFPLDVKEGKVELQGWRSSLFHPSSSGLFTAL